MTDADDDRMRAAVELAGGRPSPAANKLLRRTSRRLWGRWIPAVIVGAVVAGAVTFLLTRGGGGSRTPGPGWLTALGWILFAAGFAALIRGYVQSRGTSQFRERWRRNKPINLLSYRQRRSLLRQVQGRSDLIPEQLTLCRIMAGTLVGARANLSTTGGLVALLTGNALRSQSTVQWLLIGFLLIALLVSAPYGTLQARRANAFLAAHPEPVPDPVDG